jgi:hypothetical protein
MFLGQSRRNFMMKKSLPPKVKKFPAAKQRRLDELLERNGDGSITPSEAAALKQLVAEAEELMVANAKRLAEFSKAEAMRPPVGAVPVTVWVQPQSQHAEP